MIKSVKIRPNSRRRRTELSPSDPLRRSRWFKRGWTLQELLAPSNVVFYTANWSIIGTRTQLKIPLSQITGVPADYLTGVKPIWVASIAKRMSWMAKRVTEAHLDISPATHLRRVVNAPYAHADLAAPPPPSR